MTRHPHDEVLRDMAHKDIVERTFGMTWDPAASSRALAQIGGSLAVHACKIHGNPLPDYRGAYVSEMLDPKGATK